MILKIFQLQLELCVCQIAEGLRRASGGGGRIDSTRLQSANECQIHLLVLKLPKKKNAISTFRQDAGFYHLRNIFFRGKTLKCHCSTTGKPTRSFATERVSLDSV